MYAYESMSNLYFDVIWEPFTLGKFMLGGSRVPGGNDKTSTLLMFPSNTHIHIICISSGTVILRNSVLRRAYCKKLIRVLLVLLET